MKQWLHNVLFDPRRISVIAICILCFEIFVNMFIISRVKYTEIDWTAYMQEVEGFLNGTTDYSKLKGDTGPLVYPAGFVYIFSALYFLTDRGENITSAQYLYFGLYLITIYLLYRIYRETSTVPPYVLLITCCISYRIHSIYVLRLFNDPVAVMLLYLAINFYLADRWYTGSIIYSLAVSVKMNILLYSPALLATFIYVLGPWGTFKQLSVCAAVQYALAIPFLLTNPRAYIIRSFNLTRIFLYKWTVNWKFLPEYVFLSRSFHFFLLFAHIVLLMIFLKSWCSHLRRYSQFFFIQKRIPEEFKDCMKLYKKQMLVFVLVTCNFIGIVCSRSLHYQFYVWYYHTLPFLLWNTLYSGALRLTLLGVIEFCWNVYPSNSYSSATLLFCHLVILFGLFNNRTLPGAFKRYLHDHRLS